MKLSVALIFFAATLPAQIGSISSTASGETVYFTTWLRPAGSDHGPWRKGYRYDASGVTLVAQESASFWRVDRVSTSADGSTLGVNRSNPCTLGTACVGIVQERAEVSTPHWTHEFDGRVEIAANGRFALLTRRSGFEILPGEDERPEAFQRLYLDESAPRVEPLNGSAPAPQGRWIADNGTALATDAGAWILISINRERSQIGPRPEGVASAFLLPDAAAVVYQLSSQDADAPNALRLRYANGSDVPLEVAGALHDLSRDGRLLLFTESEGRAFTLPLPAGSPTAVTPTEGDFDLAALTPDGSAVLAVVQGRLLRINRASGEAETLLGPLPDFDRGFAEDSDNGKEHIDFLAIGSTYVLTGRHIASNAVLAPTPAGADLDGVRVTVNETPAAILWKSPSEVGYQLDWATPRSGPGQIVVTHDASGWETVLPLRGVEEVWVRNALPQVNGFSQAIHQGFDRMVTVDDPALPGEYIHIYVTGLGMVSPPVATGHPAPADPPALSACRGIVIDGRTIDVADVAFAGLAPGLVGFYQVTLHVPEDVQGPALELRCNFFPAGRYPVRGAGAP